REPPAGRFGSKPGQAGVTQRYVIGGGRDRWWGQLLPSGWAKHDRHSQLSGPRSAAYLAQSPPAPLVWRTVWGAMRPRTPVSMAGGISLVSWSRAASLIRRGSMPIVR